MFVYREAVWQHGIVHPLIVLYPTSLVRRSSPQPFHDVMLQGIPLVLVAGNRMHQRVGDHINCRRRIRWLSFVKSNQKSFFQNRQLTSLIIFFFFLIHELKFVWRANYTQWLVWGLCSCFIPRLPPPPGHRFDSHMGHLVDWVLSPYTWLGFT